MTDEVFVYVIGPNNGPQKIGFAKNVRLRLETLQVGCPFDLCIHHAESTPNELTARRIEKMAHRLLKSSRQRGEWFNVSPTLATETVRASRGQPADEQTRTSNLLENMHDDGRLTWAQYEAGVAYRQVLIKAAHIVRQHGRGGRLRLEERLAACAMRGRINARVLESVGRPGIAALIMVVFRGIEVDAHGLETLRSALDVVSQMLDDTTARKAA